MPPISCAVRQGPPSIVMDISLLNAAVAAMSRHLAIASATGRWSLGPHVVSFSSIFSIYQTPFVVAVNRWRPSFWIRRLRGLVINGGVGDGRAESSGHQSLKLIAGDQQPPARAGAIDPHCMDTASGNPAADRKR